MTTGRIEPANAAPTLLNDKLPALLYVIEEAFGPDIALFLHRFVIKGKEARAVVLEMAGCVLSGHAWPARPFPGIIRSGRSLMAVDRSDRMADGVQRHIPARERSVHLFISKLSGRLGASVKQQVVRLGVILAALQFAGEACWAQSRAADELFPRGSLFPCAAYSVGSGPVLQANADLLRFRPSGFNLLGPQYGDHNKTVLQDAKAHGLRTIYTVGADVDFLQEKGLPKPIDEMAADVTAQVRKVAPDRTIAWWYLAQEELRTWRRDEMLYLERITEAIRKADPLRRPILMYDAGHRSSAEIALTGRYLDFAAKGSYVNYSGNVDRRAWLAVSIRRRSRRHDRQPAS